jgi:hypothetical protein
MAWAVLQRTKYEYNEVNARRSLPPLQHVRSAGVYVPPLSPTPIKFVKFVLRESPSDGRRHGPSG